MSVNVGPADRLIRLIAGVVLVALALTGLLPHPALFWISLVAGVIMIATAAFRFCPLYRLIGLSTSKVSNP